MAAMAVAQHHGRPHAPTDQAWIGTLFDHVKGEWPHLERIEDQTLLEHELVRVRAEYDSVRLPHGESVVGLHAAIGYVTPDDEREGRADAIREAAVGPRAGTPGASRLPSPEHHQHRGVGPVTWFISSRTSAATSGTPHALDLTGRSYTEAVGVDEQNEHGLWVMGCASSAVLALPV